MYISKIIYSEPLDPSTWWAMKSPHGKKYEYYLYRKVLNIKERIHLGTVLRNEKRIKEKIREFEKKLPAAQRTDFDNFLLIEVSPRPKRPGPETKWVARRIRNKKNGDVIAYFLYRKIGNNTHRLYLGVKLDLETAKKKIMAFEEKQGIGPGDRTNFQDFRIELLSAGANAE